MQASHRRFHARIWFAWAILLPLGFILALLLKEGDPVDVDQPDAVPAAMQSEGGR